MYKKILVFILLAGLIFSFFTCDQGNSGPIELTFNTLWLGDDPHSKPLQALIDQFKKNEIDVDKQKNILRDHDKVMINFIPNRLAFDLFLFLRSSKKYNFFFLLKNLQSQRYLRLIKQIKSINN